MVVVGELMQSLVPGMLSILRGFIARSSQSFYCMFFLLASISIFAGSPVLAEQGYSLENPLSFKYDPNNREHLKFWEGWTNIQNSRYSEAKQCFLVGIKSYPRSYLFYFGMAVIELHEENSERAIWYLSKAAELQPDSFYAFRMRGIVYSGIQKYDKAIADFSRCISLYPHELEFFRLRGVAYLEYGDLARAKSDLAFCMSVYPTSPLTFYLKAMIEIEEGHNREAVVSCTRALGQKRNDVQVYILRSNAYRLLFDFKNARDDIKRAQALSASDLSSYISEIDDYEYGYRNAEKIPARRWLLACSAPLALQNDEGFQSLSGLPLTPDNIEKQKRLFIKWWDVHNRSELIATIKSQSEDGHNGSWMELRSEMKRHPVTMLSAAYASGRAGLSDDGVRQRLIKTYGDKFGERGILAWDLGRNISLCRWGYQVGYLSQEEAFTMMLEQAVRIQKNYGSWKQYLEEYYIGRCFWDPADYYAEKVVNERKVRRALLDPYGPFPRLPWNLPLSKATVFPAGK